MFGAVVVMNAPASRARFSTVSSARAPAGNTMKTHNSGKTARL
jgi:hypothetical protein